MHLLCLIGLLGPNRLKNLYHLSGANVINAPSPNCMDRMSLKRGQECIASLGLPTLREFFMRLKDSL